MSIVDKALAMVTPPVSEEKRSEATRNARSASRTGDWLSSVLDHHDGIREAFAKGRSATKAADRLAAMKELALVLNGHSVAEELVLYPAMGQVGEKGHAAHAYLEQTVTKAQMAELETIAPSSKDWLDKWEHIEGAVLTHMFEEESDWLLALHEKAEDPTRLTARYQEEFDRYAGR